MSHQAGVIHKNDELLSRAARPTVDALDALRQRHSARILVDALSEIRDNFCLPGYEVADLKRAIGAGTSGLFASTFQASIGLPPWRLIQECRMETTSRLLRDTTLAVPEIGFLVGYMAEPAFRRLCKRWCGLAPGHYREALRRVRTRLRELPEDVVSWSYWERCLRGELTTDEAHQLAGYLVEIYGPPPEAVS